MVKQGNSVSLCMKKVYEHKPAFTLAEVLITLGVIGVVAAMTIPTLITNYEKKVTITKLKKAYSTINQAMKLSVSENGDYSSWPKPNEVGGEEYYKQYWAPYFKNAQRCTSYTNSVCDYKKWMDGGASSTFYLLNGSSSGVDAVYSNRYTLLLPNETLVIYFYDNAESTLLGGVYIDTNGAKKPNTFGKDVFLFMRENNGAIIPRCNSSTTASIKSDCSKTGSGKCCAKKIIMDNWEFKSDYPW